MLFSSELTSVGFDELIHFTNVTTQPNSPLALVSSSDGLCRVIDIRVPASTTSSGAGRIPSVVDSFQAHSELFFICKYAL